MRPAPFLTPQGCPPPGGHGPPGRGGQVQVTGGTGREPAGLTQPTGFRDGGRARHRANVCRFHRGSRGDRTPEGTGMAIRRAKQKEQVIAKLSSVAPPGETFVACVHVETGPSPWLNAIFDEVPFLGLIVALTRKFYFLTLTNTSV